jgi:hypothetical protein
MKMCPEAGLLNAALLILINHHISVLIRILIHHFQKVLDLDPDLAASDLEAQNVTCCTKNCDI